MDILELYRKHNRFGELMGMDFKVTEPGTVTYFLTIKPEHLATPLAAHGGLISAFMDGIIGVAALSSVSMEKKVVSTIEFKINYLSPALLNDELVGIGKVIQKGNRIIISEGEIKCTNRNDILIAKAIGTFNAYPAEKINF